MSEVWLVRHGETTANAAGIWQGHGSVGLSALGREQAAVVGERLRRTSFDLVVASDLERTRQTAAAAGFDPEFDPAWREMDIGRWEGLTREEVVARYGDELRALAAGEEMAAGGGETWGGFCARADAALDALGRRLGPEQRALVVTHGGTIHVLAAGLLRFRSRGRPWPVDHSGNTGVSVLVGEGGAWQVRTLNDDGHLGKAPVPDEETTVVGLARHGESEANTVGIWHGITDGPLSPRGRVQGVELAARYDTVDHIYSSHLQRARLTAASFGAGRGLEPSVRPDLYEMDYGHWEGLTSEQIRDLFPDDWAANYVHGGDLPRGRTGETAAGTAARDLLESPGNTSVTHLRVGRRGIVVADYNSGVV